MKSIFLLPSMMLLLSGLYVQNNVGIGTNTPTSPLTVMANGSNKGIIQKNGNTEVGFYTSATGTRYRNVPEHKLLLL